LSPPRSAAVVAGLVLVLCAAGASASDHADPGGTGPLEPDITGLFVFPEGDELVVILTFRPRAPSGPPYGLVPFEYRVHVDLHTPVTYESAEDRARYGGTIRDPGGIAADVTLRFRLDDHASLKDRSFEGLAGADGVRVWAGVRDDPFIFSPFFGANVIAVATAIPFSAFPPGREDFLMWATTHEVDGGGQIDHVGRSLRTQLPRFGFLNTLPPREHVAALHAKAHSRARVQRFLQRCLPPVVPLYQSTFAIRSYDYFPDVLVFTTRHPPGYPNGRRLPDDVVGATCAQGDCLLVDLTFVQSAHPYWPRATANDKPFLDEFPYLAEPWPASATAAAPAGPCEVCIALLVVLGLLAGWLVLRWRRRRAVAAPPSPR